MSTGEAASATLGRATLCALEDHRQCPPEACSHAAYWWPILLTWAAPILAARGRRYLTACLIPACVREADGPRLILCTDTRTSLTSARNSHYRMGHAVNCYEARGIASVHGWVPCCEATDGGGARLI